MLGRNWWTLGFEAIGATDNLRGMLESTAAHVFDPAIADGFEFTLDESGSYASWLRKQRDAR